MAHQRIRCYRQPNRMSALRSQHRPMPPAVTIATTFRLAQTITTIPKSPSGPTPITRATTFSMRRGPTSSVRRRSHLTGRTCFWATPPPLSERNGDRFRGWSNIARRHRRNDAAASGAPETYVGFPPAGSYTVYHFHVDFSNPPASTWTTFATPAAAAFHTIMYTGGRACVPQSGGTGVNGLDGIGDRFMFRAAYRNFGTHGFSTRTLQFLRCAHRCELRRGRQPAPARQAYVGSSSRTSPMVLWLRTKRAPTNPTRRGAGWAASRRTMPVTYGRFQRLIFVQLSIDALRGSLQLTPEPLAQGEATLFSGTGSQSSTGNRWGDYSAMSVDPEDDCTFWYTKEYLRHTSPIQLAESNW